jgi:ferredoxin
MSSAKTLLKAVLDVSDHEKAFTWTQSLPQRRRILLEALARLSPAGTPDPEATLPWAGLKLAGGCTFCGACVPLCPSGALGKKWRGMALVLPGALHILRSVPYLLP